MSTQATETEAIKRSVTVNCSVEHAFETFTERIHEWWPLGKHSIDHYETGTPAETVVFQGGAGGQVYERTSKGEELKWADVVYDVNDTAVKVRREMEAAFGRPNEAGP